MTARVGTVRDVVWTDERIETRRLRLRAFAGGDRDVLVHMLRSPGVRRYLGGPVDETTIARIADSAVGERPDVFCVADRATDVAIGTVRLDRHRSETEVSYEFLPTTWGRGLATEAVRTLVDWTWIHHPDPSLIAVTQTANVRSCRLLERLGFRHEREFEEWDAMQSQFRIERPQPD